MAEVIIGVVASAITLVEAASTTGKLTKKIIKARHPEQRLQEVFERRDAAKSLVQNARHQLQAYNSTHRTLALLRDVFTTLERLDRQFGKLDAILCRLHKRDRHGICRPSTTRWLQCDSRIEKLLKDIEARISHQLVPTLASVTLSTCDQIQSGLGEIRKDRLLESNNSSRPSFSINIRETMNCPETVSTNSLLYFLGTLLIALSGSPSCRRRSSCKHCYNRTTVYYFCFVFSGWVTRALAGSVYYNQSKGLQLRNLRSPYIRPATDEVFSYVMLGKLEAVQDAFSLRQASPWDIDQDGNTLLWYALSAFNTQMTAVCLLLLNEGVEPLLDGTGNSSRLSTTFTYAWRLFKEKSVGFADVRRLCLFFDASAQKAAISFEPDMDDSHYTSMRTLRYSNNMNAPSLEALQHFQIGINPHIRGNNHIIEAVIHHNDQAVRMLLEGSVLKNPNLALDAQNEFGFTALHYAIFHNQYRCLPILLEAGADCSITSFRDHNILHFAAAHANVETIEILSRADKLKNADLLGRPTMSRLHMTAVRWKCGSKKFRPMTEGFWDAWETLLAKLGDWEDDDWACKMPTVDEDNIKADPWDWGYGEEEDD